MSQEVVTGMITEVSILCGHDDDGKLSFRDYMSCMSYEKIKNEHNKVAEEALEAAEECLERGITDPQVRAPRPARPPPTASLRLHLSCSYLLRTHTLIRPKLHPCTPIVTVPPHAPCAVPPPTGAHTHDQRRG